MLVENDDDYIYTKNEINDFPPSNSNNTIHCDDHTTICQEVIKPNSNWKEEFEKHKDLFPASDSNLRPLYIDPYESLEWTLKGSISWCKVINYPMEKTLQFLISELQSRLKTLQK